MSYQPGLHIIAELSVDDVSLLQTCEAARVRIDGLISEHGLQKLGEVYHNFQPQGYTAVVCLSESHLSLHAWPEYGRLHMDVYLSNFMRNNDEITQKIFDELVAFFKAGIINRQTLVR